VGEVNQVDVSLDQTILDLFEVKAVDSLQTVLRSISSVAEEERRTEETVSAVGRMTRSGGGRSVAEGQFI
jgi:hypothetical protein